MSTRRQFIKNSMALMATGIPMLDTQANQALKPDFAVPANACDCHVHIVSKNNEKFPMVSPRAYTPPPAEVPALQNHLKGLGLTRVVVVQPSFYGTDNRCTLEAVQSLGKSARAVVVINKSTTDQEIERMVAQGARGVRMNIETSGSTFDINHLQNEILELANRVKAFNLHVQIYASSKVVASAADAILKSPVPIVLDHFAGVKAKDFANNPDLPVVVELIKSGRVYVKLSGVYRVSTPDYSEVSDLARLYLESNPDRMVWASDWPHTNTIAGTPYEQVTPYRVIDDFQVFNLIPKWALEPKLREKLLTLNAQNLYRF